MTSIDRRRISAVAILLASATGAWAELGGKVSDIAGSDQARMLATRRVAQSPLYTTHASVTTAGVQVVEYAAASGTVFAVTWKGPARPDLKQLLGPYFDAFTEAEKSRHMGRRPLLLRRSDLVIQSGGHMRAFSGRAYLPAAIPAGVSLEDIR